MLTREMLEEIQYPDVGVLDILTKGASLAGAVDPSPIFESQFKPCLATVDQLKASAKKRNEMILNMTKSSGSEEVDMKLLEETLLEVERDGRKDQFL